MRLELVKSAGIDTREEGGLVTPLIVPPRAAVNECDAAVSAIGVDTSKILIAIAPGAKQSANIWPLSRFAEIGARALAEYGVTLVVVGGVAERDVGVVLTERWNAGFNFCGALSVLGTASLLKKCRLLIGLDTGTTHLAASQGIPCVAIYSGKNWPGRWEPVGDHNVIIRHRVPCEGCELRNCNVDGHPCLTEIDVDAVWSKVSPILAGIVQGSSIKISEERRCVE